MDSHTQSLAARSGCSAAPSGKTTASCSVSRSSNTTANRCNRSVAWRCGNHRAQRCSVILPIMFMLTSEKHRIPRPWVHIAHDVHARLGTRDLGLMVCAMQDDFLHMISVLATSTEIVLHFNLIASVLAWRLCRFTPSPGAPHKLIHQYQYSTAQKP